MKRCSSGTRSNCSRNPIGSPPKIRASIRRGGAVMTGTKSICARMSLSMSIGLGEAEKRDVEPTAVVEIELIGLIDHRLGVDSGAEIEPAGRNATDDARLRRQGNEIDDLLLGGHRGDAFGHADAEIDHRV